MGNSNSQSLHHVHAQHVQQQQQQQQQQQHARGRGGVTSQQWAHSYPRDMAARTRITAPQNKVLPERIPGQRLRITDNGAILHNGGTISNRRQSPVRYSDEEPPNERYRSRSSSNHRGQSQQPRQAGLKFNGKRFGSEPDLRNPKPHNDSPAKQRITRTRKKYKAPPAPPLPEGESHGPDSSSPDSYQWENLDPPARRLRLFKTREETKKGPVARTNQPARSISPEPRRSTSNKERNGRERERSRGREPERIVLKVRDQDRNNKEERRDERIILNVRDHDRNIPNGKDHDRIVANGKDHREQDRISERENERNVPNGRSLQDHGRILPDHGRILPDHGRILPDHGIRVKVEKRLNNAPTIPRVNGIRHPPQPPAAAIIVPRNLSTPEFQAELLTAAQRLRHSAPPAPRLLREHKPDHKDHRPDHRLDSRELRTDSREFKLDRGRKPRQGEVRGVPVGEAAELRPRGDGSGRESTPEPIPPRRRPEPRKESKHEISKSQENHWDILPPVNQRPLERDVPTKTFYFGMEQGERDAVERFAASIHRVPPAPPRSGSGGSMSSDMEGDDELGGGGIALQLRPMLPKKQLEIPRFSPTAAWRLLSALETPTAVNTGDEPPVLLEERIQRLSRPMAPPLPQMAPRSSHDKSGDSGISGDASPGGCHEDSSEAPLASPPIRKTLSPPLHQRALVAAWTPQQDLGEEESSSDGGVDEAVPNGSRGIQPKFSPRAQVFSLSLPRDERLCLALYSENKTKRDVQPTFNSLKKLKRSVSGAFTALNTPTKIKDDQLLDENWLLSRSIANSLNSGHLVHAKPLSHSSSPSTPDHEVSQRTSFSYLATGGHVMYLPEYKSRQEATPDSMSRPYGALRATGMMSKSCENISASEMRQLDRTPSPDTDIMEGHGRMSEFQEQGDLDMEKELPTGKRGKNRRFTFQSTVRQIERRRISERLSREAESKERRRLGELEAMRRVEEEFQRKRAPEKANIRHQLRLFNLDEQLFSSLPNGWTDSARAEPDGATSSSPSSSTANTGSSPDPAGSVRPPSTQILSEFREPRRDYRDYRPARYTELGPESLPEKRATVHPPVVFDMPKNAHIYVAKPHRQTNGVTNGDVDHGGMSTPRSSSSDNYRRDFAHGALRSLASSDSELSQPNTRPTSRQRSRSPSPMAGRRSKSAEPCSSSEEEPTAIINADLVTTTAATNRISLTTVQPFVLNGKGYRPIAFNLGTNPTHNVAQPVN